ncbi:hypothetical protein GUJ93_ZPchr0001g33068 [Zizania palustris]|uniref:ENT domain-containing protein n=1 Tax=Zizania palustris TaxID=103762 RepID=A0A8J5RLB2_ZIZPA|nr:hypothetical protein GUJ93_ZPchr0001g33068 [Zizania palustris]
MRRRRWGRGAPARCSGTTTWKRDSRSDSAAPRSTAAKHHTGQFVRPPVGNNWANIKRSRRALDNDTVRDVGRIEANSKRIRPMEEEEVKLAKYDNVEVIEVNPEAFVNKQQERSREERDVVGRGGNTISDTNSSSSSSSSSSSVGRESRSADSTSSSSDSGNRKSIENGGHAVVSAAPRSPPRDAQRASNQKPPPPPLPQDIKDENSYADDNIAEYRASERPAALVANGVHRLEVDAYAALMKAFHANGVLTWEKEEMLSDLRRHLHISGEEHLQMIWQLNGKMRPTKPDK